jgi:aminomethyltransferase
MSTNDVAKLQPGQGAATIFTTPIARIIDRTVVYARSDNVLMLTSRGNQGRVAQWLRKYIFFNDDVQIKDVTDETAMIALYGAEANRAIRRIGEIDVADLPLHHWRSVRLGEVEIMIARADPIGGDGFHLIFDQSAHDLIWQTLIDAGVTPIGEDTYQVLRVEAGRPEFGHELGDEYIPLEANLWSDVSFTKGCYTGQEIIARLESRQRLAKHLVGLRFEDEITPPSALFVEGHEAGRVTSIVHSPRFSWIGLGYLKTAQGAGAPMVESRSGERTVGTRVVELPFKLT